MNPLANLLDEIDSQLAAAAPELLRRAIEVMEQELLNPLPPPPPPTPWMPDSSAEHLSSYQILWNLISKYKSYLNLYTNAKLAFRKESLQSDIFHKCGRSILEQGNASTQHYKARMMLIYEKICNMTKKLTYRDLNSLSQSSAYYKAITK